MKNELLQEAKISSAVLDIVNAVILVMNKDGKIVLFNKASEKLTGYKFEEVKGKCPWDLFILPKEIDGVRNVFSRLTSGDFPNTHINYWLTKNGGKKLIDWSNTVIADKKGRVAFVIATGQ